MTAPGPADETAVEGIDPDRPRVPAETNEQWRAWLAENHATALGAWLVSWKKASGRPAMSYEKSVIEALAWGWVDSKGGKLDDDRSMLYFAPRRTGSAWARTNKRRVDQLEADGLMQPAGRAVVDRAKADGTWSMLDDVEALVVPADLAAAFGAVPGSRAQWDAFPPSARRGILEWIVQAKRPATRARRLAETAQSAGRGERANQWRPKG